MPNTLVGYADPGLECDFFVYSVLNPGQIWNIFTAAYEAASGTDPSPYRIAASQPWVPGRFIATAPAGAGPWELRLRGGTVAESTLLDHGNLAPDVNVKYVDGEPATPDQGPGADDVTVTVKDELNVPIADADVWITSDAPGTNVIAGTLQTNSMGQATFLLDAGNTYYLWSQKDGENAIRGQQFVAVAD